MSGHHIAGASGYFDLVNSYNYILCYVVITSDWLERQSHNQVVRLFASMHVKKTKRNYVYCEILIRVNCVHSCVVEN